MRPVGKRSAKLIVTVCLTALFVTLLFALHRLNGPRVVGRVLGPDGSKMYLIQYCNWWITEKPFRTMLYVQKPDGQWRGFYADHNDKYWSRRHCRVNLSGDQATFYRTTTPAITFDFRNEAFILHSFPAYSGDRFDVMAGYHPLKGR